MIEPKEYSSGMDPRYESTPERKFYLETHRLHVSRPSDQFNIVGKHSLRSLVPFDQECYPLTVDGTQNVGRSG